MIANLERPLKRPSKRELCVTLSVAPMNVNGWNLMFL
jgi:hypothetical protein